MALIFCLHWNEAGHIGKAGSSPIPSASWGEVVPVGAPGSAVLTGMVGVRVLPAGTAALVFDGPRACPVTL